MSVELENAFLRLISPEGLAALAPHLSEVKLTAGDLLLEAGRPVEWVHFPEGAVLSVRASQADGTRVEAALLGQFGVSGFVEALGSGVSAVDCIVQVSGPARRLRSNVLRELATDPQFVAAAWRSAELVLIETRQGLVCQALHPAEARLANWLLECSDRTGGAEPLKVTQEDLGTALGVHRTTVTSFMVDFQRRGLINASRGKVEILSREGLESTACDCRQIIQGHRRALLAGAESDDPRAVR
jgi:CRP-like cAMP-binding protein